MLFSSPLRSFTFLHLFTEQKENCKLIHKGLAFLSTSSLVLIDCSGIPLSTREGFVCAKETIQEGRKFFFAYLTICCVAVHSCQQLVKNTFYKEIFKMSIHWYHFSMLTLVEVNIRMLGKVGVRSFLSVLASRR